MTSTTDTGSTNNARFGQVFLALFGLGLLGALSLIPTITGQMDMLPPELADLSAPVTVALSLINILIMLAVSVAIGTLLAHRVGLRSLVAEKIRAGKAIWPALRPHIPMAFTAGVIYMVVAAGLDFLTNLATNAELFREATAEANVLGQLLTSLLVGLLYGGILEELLLRWGIMTLLVWIGWRVVQRKQGPPQPTLVWAAIILTALLFGIGHLPGLAAMGMLTPLMVVRTILLNALGGFLFGWLFWRHSLEVAMVAHAAAHVGLFGINIVLVLLNLSVV